MNTAKHASPEFYTDFNHFFTRELNAEARPVVTGENNIACPVDGAVSQSGKIEDNLIFQAKGFNYSLESLLGDSNDLAQLFKNGDFSTLYLSPRDYHRIHMPLDAQLREMMYVPGKLFSVNQITTSRVPELFARNERVITLFDTAIGPMAMILVGAIFVSSIETVWAGEITAGTSNKIKSWDYRDRTVAPIRFSKGEEMGRFNMGSTVIVLFAENKMEFSNLVQPDKPVQMGQLLGTGL